MDRAGDDQLAVPSSPCFLLSFGLIPCPGSCLLPVAPSWRSPGSGALHPSPAMGCWTPCPSLKDSSWGEDRATAPLAVCVWRGAWVGQEASWRWRWLPTTANQHQAASPSPLGGTQELGPSLHHLRGEAGVPWALALSVLWGSVEPGPAVFKSSSRIPLPLGAGHQGEAGDTVPLPP